MEAESERKYFGLVVLAVLFFDRLDKRGPVVESENAVGILGLEQTRLFGRAAELSLHPHVLVH